MSSDEELQDQLAVVSQATPTKTSETVTAIKNSMLFANDWSTLLMSAPTVVKSLGTCFVASSSPLAGEVQLRQPAGGFKVLRSTSLKANLVRCGNLGRVAFIEAEKSMSGIQLGSSETEDTVKVIMGLLIDPEAQVKTLMRHTNDLKETADTCLEYAVLVDKRFDEWLAFVMELEEVCTDHQTSTASDLTQAKINLLSEQTRLDHTKIANEQAEDAVKALKKELDVTSAAFKKASDDYPDGWELVGQQIVSSLADTFNNVVSKALPVLMAAVSPVGKVDLFAGTAMNTAGGIEDMVRGGINGGAGNPGSGGGHPAPAPAAATVRPTNMADPAYSQVGKDIVFFDTLEQLLNGAKDGGVDWDKARGKGDGDAKSSSSFLRTMFDDAKQSFSRLATQEDPSMRYLRALEGVSRIATELHDQVLKGKVVGYKLPEKDDPIVENWQSKFEDQYTEARKIYAASKAIPGNAPSGFPMASAQAVDPGASVDPAKDPGLAKTLIASAQFQLNVAQEAYLQTQKNYQRSTEVFIEQKTRMAEISANLSRLKSETLNLTEVLKVLQDSIELIGRMKHDIANLVTFFKGLSILIEHVVDKRVRAFVKHLRGDFSDDDDLGSDDSPVQFNPDAKIGDFKLVDAEREFLFRTVVTIRSYFSLFADIASMWVNMSAKNIAPGMKMIDRLGKETEGTANNSADMQKKVAELEAWSEAAVKEVEVQIAKRQKQIKDGLQERFDKYAAITQKLPAPPPAMKKAITEGTKPVAATTEASTKWVRDLMS